MKAILYAHRAAHPQDFAATVDAMRALCRSRGWPVHAEILGGESGIPFTLQDAVMAAPFHEASVLVVPSVEDLKPTFESLLDDEVAPSDTKHVLAERLGKVFETMAARRVDYFDVSIGTPLSAAEFRQHLAAMHAALLEWRNEERRERSEMSKAAVARARAEGKRIGRPRKDTR